MPWFGTQCPPGSSTAASDLGVELMTYRASPLPLEEIVAGHWYFGFDCLACEARFAVLEDQSAGRRQLNFSGDGYVQALCPHCLVEGLYTANELRQFEAT